MKSNIPDLVLSSSRREMSQPQIDAILAHGKKLGHPLLILEAGCGREWSLDLTGIDYTLTGVDLDPAALELRKTKVRDLDVAILGDLCSVELPEASFDVVFSSYVLEHVQRADLALQNFVRWLKPGGLLILCLPERGSARGFYTRVLPHRFHLWYYRYVLHSKMAGLPGYPPYPTYLHPIIGSERLCRFLAENGVKCVGRCGNGFGPETSGPLIMVQQALVKLTSILSFGKLTADYTDVSYIAVKNPSD
jgi:SAM-dependent methyltransferase